MSFGRDIRIRAFMLLCPALFILSVPIEAQRQMEDLDRGLLAMKVPAGVFINWRILGTEWPSAAYNIYRDGVKITPAPITGAPDFVDSSGTTASAYFVRAVMNGNELSGSDTVTPWNTFYYDLPVREIPGGYQLNDASVGDLDGDGDYEIVIKRISPDTSAEPQYTHLLEAYQMDGTYMWTIDYGPNRIGPQQINFIVYDLDGDGRAEVVTNTSEGTIDGTGVEIGDTDGDHITNYRYSALNDDIIDGPEFLSVYEGETGKEIERINYIAREPLSQWGLDGMSLTQLAHRADNVMMAVIYADGKTPTLVMCRGIYHRTKMVALNFREQEFTTIWTFDSDDWPVGFRGQGNHNLSVADVDADGRDEIIFGSMTVDDDGTGLYGTGLGHGDALHVTDMDPDRPGLEVWQAHENGPHYGGTYRDAATGEILIQYFGNRDMGRACAGDITPAYPGFELWGATECPIYNVKGSVLGPTTIPVNFMIWWDGDLTRELLDHLWLGSDVGTGIGTISKFNGSDDDVILNASGTYTNNYTKGNPCLSADILGDWREEVIFRTTDNQNLRIYASPIPTEQRIYTLMHDPQYRLAIAWQNNAYNQPPHPGFYLGNGMDTIPPPPVTGDDLVWNSEGKWDTDTSISWIKNGVGSAFQDGENVLFDILGGDADTVRISGTPEPSFIRVNAPTNYTFEGQGRISGSGGLLKMGSGELRILNHNSFTGYSAVLSGGILVDGSLDSRVNVKKFASAGGSGHFNNGLTLEHGSAVFPGDRDGPDTLHISGDLKARQEVNWNFDLSGDSSSHSNDMIKIDGNLQIEGAQNFSFTQLDDSLQKASYTLVMYTGNFTGDLQTISVEGVAGIPWEIYDEGGSIRIRFFRTRSPGTLEWQGGDPDDWDLLTSYNWHREGKSDRFVPYDTVWFTDEGMPHSLVNLVGELFPGRVKISAAGDYSFEGEGMISGPGDLVKDGQGKLAIRTINNYSGATRITGGILEIMNLTDSGEKGPLGKGSQNTDDLVLDGGTLRILSSSTSDRNISLGPANGTLDLAAGELRMEGRLEGEGQLLKTGMGTLTWTQANQHLGGTILRKGRIHLATEEANLDGPGPGMFILENATLSMADDRNSYTDACSWNFSVPEGFQAELDLDSRCTLTGSLQGSGTLNLYIPFIRSELGGDWSAFAGRINTGTGSGGGSFLVGNPAGFPAAHINLGDNVTALYRYSSSVTIEIGTLTGSASSRLGAGGEQSGTVTWKIGGNNTNAAYPGTICDDQFKNTGASAALLKTGTGTWTLSGNNTYTGGTTIEGGSLWIQNLSGSGTGTGNVRVQNLCTLGGTGIIDGPVYIESGGVVNPGPEPGTSLKIDSTLVMDPGSFLGIEVDPVNKKHSRLDIRGEYVMDGRIYFTNSGSVRFAAGDVYDLADAGSISGNLEGFLPSSPGEGLKWDVSEWLSGGIVKVVLASAVEEKPVNSPVYVYPNPFSDELTVELPDHGRNVRIRIENIRGKMLLDKIYHSENTISLVTGFLEPGYYLLKIESGPHYFINKLVKY